MGMLGVKMRIIPCRCSTSGTGEAGLSPLILDTPIGLSWPVASSGGEFVPNDCPACDDIVKYSDIKEDEGKAC